MVLATPVALILMEVELQCSHIGQELGVEKPLQQTRDYSPAVSPAGETPVAVLLVDARGEQEARVGEDLKEKKIVKKGESQGRSEHLCSGTVPREVCAAGLVFAHRVAILHNPQSHRILKYP